MRLPDLLAVITERVPDAAVSAMAEPTGMCWIVYIVKDAKDIRIVIPQPWATSKEVLLSSALDALHEYEDFKPDRSARIHLMRPVKKE